MASPSLVAAMRSLTRGGFVAIYDADGREEETDLFVLATHATSEKVRTLRRDAGGLVFLAVDPDVGARFGLPFLQDLYAEAASRHPVLSELVADDIPYDAKSSFSLTLNARSTYTGITDEDRALTARRFAELSHETRTTSPARARRKLGREFRAPGHVHLCVAADGLLLTRRGHTELAVALGRISDARPAVLLGAEMLGPGRALPKSAARAFCRRHRIPFIEGEALVGQWQNFKRDEALSRMKS
ncbi:MAG: 3,4-dihydroxy-2-butanone-4-phosphate synthase [Methanobacteriota archaeon]